MNYPDEPPEIGDDPTETSGQSASEWTEAGMAAVLLRILGVYFFANGLIMGSDPLARLFFDAGKFGLELTLWRQVPYLIYSGAELLVGTYFLFGGQWVYDKVLTPMGGRRREPADEWSEEYADDDSPAEEKSGNDKND